MPSRGILKRMKRISKKAPSMKTSEVRSLAKKRAGKFQKYGSIAKGSGQRKFTLPVTPAKPSLSTASKPGGKTLTRVNYDIQQKRKAAAAAKTKGLVAAKRGSVNKKAADRGRIKGILPGGKMPSIDKTMREAAGLYGRTSRLGGR